MLRIQMISMRLKTGPAISSEWRCLFCFHVRTVTIILGIWHLMLHILALSVLAVILRNRNLLHEGRANADLDHLEYTGNGWSVNSNGYETDGDLEGLPTPLSKIEPSFPIELQRQQRDHGLYYPDLDMGALVTMCTLSITLLLVYGAIKGKATHLLPFFCLQLFDFAISTLTATGYACYMRSMHRLVAEIWHLPFRNYLLQLSPQCLSLVVYFTFLVSMIIKAYCIGIVWRCYKYLTLRQQALRSAIHYIMPGEMSDLRPPSEPDYSSLLPDYEAACKQTPPPSYQAAVAGTTISSTEFPAQSSIETEIASTSNTVTIEAQTIEEPVAGPSTLNQSAPSTPESPKPDNQTPK